MAASGHTRTDVLGLQLNASSRLIRFYFGQPRYPKTATISGPKVPALSIGATLIAGEQRR
jgi:hypothetical protein